MELWANTIALHVSKAEAFLLKKEQSPKNSFHSMQPCSNTDEISSPYIIYPPQQCLFELHQATPIRVFYFNQLQRHARILTKNRLIESHVFLLFV